MPNITIEEACDRVRGELDRIANTDPGRMLHGERERLAVMTPIYRKVVQAADAHDNEKLARAFTSLTRKEADYAPRDRLFAPQEASALHLAMMQRVLASPAPPARPASGRRSIKDVEKELEESRLETDEAISVNKRQAKEIEALRIQLGPDVGPSEEVPTLKIRTDGGTQTRAAYHDETVATYREAYKAGVELPPVVVFFDGEKYWLADGFHRFRAWREIHRNQKPIRAVVHQGTRRDAVLYSVGANAAHGLPRTPADKRRAVDTLLADAEWGQWSDREIARKCNVGHNLVSTMRREGGQGTSASVPGVQMDAAAPDVVVTALTHPPTEEQEGGASVLGGQIEQPDAGEGETASVAPPRPPAERRAERNGKTYTMRTEAIGKRDKPAATPANDSRALLKTLADRLSSAFDEANAAYARETGHAEALGAILSSLQALIEQTRQSAFERV